MTHELRRVLCVDDEEDILTVTKLALEIVGGFETRQCTGADALLQVENYHPDLILLDALMPQMGGRAILKRLSHDPATASIPVIFMTAEVQPEEVAEYLTLGACGVISKPFDPMALADQLREIWSAQLRPLPLDR